MKKIFILLLTVFITQTVFSQVAVNSSGSAADASAMLDVSSTSKGMLIPRMTTSQRTAISSPATGLLVFDTTTKSFWFYDGGSSSWVEIKSSNNNTELADADNDTKIQVEKNADNDKIHFTTGGTDYFTMQNGRLNIDNTGSSVFIGYEAGANDDLTDNYNTFVGFRSGKNNTSGESNIAVGFRSLRDNTTGVYNVAIGSDAMLENEDGSYNTVLGGRSMENNVSGVDNVAVGAFSLNGNNIGNNNTAVGYFSLYSHKRNNENTAVGRYALVNDTSGASNTAIGSGALRSNINGNNNTALGMESLASSTGADENTAIGYYALYHSTGNKNSALGSLSLYNNQGGNYNSAVGYRSAYNNTTGGYNTSIGDSSLYSNTTGYLNVAIGHGAMFANTTTWHSVAVGTAAMKKTNGGADNTAVGDSALFANVGGSYNTALGNSALQGNTGSRNTALGNDALRSNSGTVNTAVGHQALTNNTLGYFNVGVGGYALNDVTTGYNNTVLGYNSGKGITTGDNNTIIGAEVTGLSPDMNNNIIIADGEGHQRIRVLSDGKVGIGTTAPDTKLNVFETSAAEPIAHFQSDDDVSVRVNGQGGESYVEIQNDDTGSGNTWKVGLNDNTKLSIQYGTQGTMNSNTEAIKISTDGYVYKPKMPYFFVTGGLIVVSTGSPNCVIIDYDGERFDNGNNFDLSTDKFTAPVKGVYFFSWSINHSDGQNMGGSYGYFYPGYIRTSDTSTFNPFMNAFQETSEENSYYMTAIIQLNSGEEVWVESLAWSNFRIGLSEFSGYLITALE